MRVSIALTLFVVYNFICFGESGTIWPQPSSITYDGVDNFVLNPSSFTFHLASGSSPLLQRAFARYQNLVFYTNGKPQTEAKISKGSYAINSLIIDVDSFSENLQFGVPENYILNITSPNSYLSASSVFGVLRGLESFSQLVDFDGTTYSIAHGPIYIEDTPRFPHRGLLVDSARHYLPVSTIKNAIDALAYSKMNTLHWHIVDAQSFPIESTAYPLLSKAAWSEYEIYTADEVKEIVQYGVDRGIRILPEFDVPGHSAAWGVGYPQLTVGCPKWQANINNIPLDPTQDFTYQVLTGFLTDMTKLFVDNWLHMGGDEVVTGCYLDNSTIVSWMQKNGVGTADGLVRIFEQKLQKIVGDLGKTFVGWEEVFNAYGYDVPTGTIIEVWQDEPTLLSVAQAGLRGILAYGWYLDHLQDTWIDFYNNEPFQSSDWTNKLEGWIIGGEACMWGEQVNWANFESRVWPRAAATAERLWSPKTVDSVDAAQPRLVDFTCVLNRRGIESDPIQPGPSCYPTQN